MGYGGRKGGLKSAPNDARRLGSHARRLCMPPLPKSIQELEDDLDEQLQLLGMDDSKEQLCDIGQWGTRMPNTGEGVEEGPIS